MLNSLLKVEGSQVFTYVILGVLVVAIIAMFMFSSRRRKKQEQDAQDLINAVKPGNKVKTIGGICGIVVEVNEEENTFVLETGTEQSGKCFVKFDKQAIYQTDAVVEKTQPAVPEEKSEPFEEAKTEEAAPAEEVVAEPEAVAAEPVAEEVVEAPKPKKTTKTTKTTKKD